MLLLGYRIKIKNPVLGALFSLLHDTQTTTWNPNNPCMAKYIPI